MNETLRRHVPKLRSRVLGWLPAGLRLVVAVLVAKPALSKALTYGSSVAFFTEIGIPYPAVMVLIVGTIEITAVVMLLFGVGGRLAALSLIPVMLVAIAYVGPDWKNVSVLFGAIAILVVGTGSPSLWRPTERLLG